VSSAGSHGWRDGRPRRRACPTGKHRFRDHKEAVRFLWFAADARRRSEVDRVETTHAAVRDYRCAHCRGWHVTSWATAAGSAAKLAPARVPA